MSSKNPSLQEQARALLEGLSTQTRTRPCCEPRFKSIIDAVVDAEIELRAKTAKKHSLRQLLRIVQSLAPDFPVKFADAIGSHLRDHDRPRYDKLYGIEET